MARIESLLLLMLFTTYTSRLSIIIMIMCFYISMTNRDVNGVCQNEDCSGLNGFTWLDSHLRGNDDPSWPGC